MDFYLDPVFKDLLRELLQEEYAIQRTFSQKNLETIRSEVEADSEIFLGTFSNDGAAQEREKASFERVKGALCVLLAYFDLMGLESLPEGETKNFVGSELKLRPQQSPQLTLTDLLKQIKLSEQGFIPRVLLDKLIAKQIIEHVEIAAFEFVDAFFSILNQEKDRVVRSFLSRSNDKIALTQEGSQDLQKFFQLKNLNYHPNLVTQTLVISFRLLNDWQKGNKKYPTLKQVAYLLLSFGLKTQCFETTLESIYQLAELFLRLDENKQEANTVSFIPDEAWLISLETNCSEVLVRIEEMRRNQSLMAKAA